MPSGLNKTCGLCNETKDEESFSFKSRATRKRQGWCKPCARAYGKEHSKHRDRYLENSVELRRKERLRNQTRVGRFGTYKSAAKKRGLQFSITQSEFDLFWNKPCYYCGDDIQTIGLDRVDSSGGYILGNIRSCCAPCNRAKLARTSADFILMCVKVATKHSVEEIKLVKA